ncbi:MAG: ABC transporter substrate-binding protein [Gaiellales bacterium]
MRRAVIGGAICAVAALAAASLGTAAGPHKRGGTFIIVSAGDIDYADPGQTYYSFTSQMLTPVNRALYTVPADKYEPKPDIAAGPAKISADGKTVTIKIRKGVRFAPPVNREVTAADVKYAIERGFSASVANPYAGAYFSVIAGTPSNLPKTPKPVSGIKTPDKYTLVFKLKHKTGVFVGALVMPLTAPVPKEYAAKFDNKTTSDYAFNQVSTGPYMIKNDSKGNIKGVGYSPGKFMTLVRNPNWNPKTDFRPAYLDEIQLKEGFSDTTVATRQIISGTADYNGDFTPPPALLRQLATTSNLKDNFYRFSLGIAYMAMNMTKKPFDDLHVRRAVEYVVDRNAMRLVVGGPLTGPIATHIIGPDFKGTGFEAAGGFAFDPYPTKNFAGDVAKAKAELRKAGFASGMYDGPAVTAVVGNTPVGVNYGKTVAASLAKIGITVNVKPVSPDAMYTKFCNVPKNQPELCPSVGWLPDFKEPQTLLDPTFNGNAILPSGNSNWPQLNDAAINKAMEKAKLILDPQARYRAWGKIDKMIMALAPVVPLQWTDTINVVSDRVVVAKMTAFQGQPDLAFTSLK